MFCTTCQKEIAADSNFCYFCGARQASASAAGATSGDTGARRLRRSTTDKVFGGVCGGAGEFFDIDPVLIRVVWAIVAVVGGVGILAYIICWIVIDPAPAGAVPVPERPIVAPPQSTRRLRRSATNAKWAGVCGGIAEHLGMDPTVVRLAWAILSVFPGAIVGGLIAYLVAWLVMPAPEPASASSGQPIPHSS